jgi:putative oxygen-independent coproporphyrinogen III oxidase
MNLGIYIQVPFCQTKCTYCNFHTGVFSKTIYKPYIDAVCREISESRNLREVAVDTVYLGGGSPSLFDPEDLSKVLNSVRKGFPPAWNEVTLEADPETITADKATAWRDAGINRISLGVQSFHDDELRVTGRMHRLKDIDAAFGFLRGAGCTNISADLISGLPCQTEASWQFSMEQLVELRPEHISIYLLEIDEGSRLGKEALTGGAKYNAGAIPSDDVMADNYEWACARLARAGYEHYEISNWGLPGFVSRHNLKYWRREPYLGFGAGAHSFDGRKRWANVHDPAAYIAAIAEGRSTAEQEEELTSKQAIEEELFLGLRQLAGIDVAELEREYGEDISNRLARLIDDGLLERSGNTIRLNPAKLTIANEVFVEVLG